MWASSTCPDLRGTQLFTIDCGCSCGHVTHDPVIGSSQNLRSDRGQQAYGLTVASGFWSWFVGLFGVHRQVSLTPPRPLGVRYWWQDQAKQGCGCVTRGQRCFCSWGCGRRWAVVLWTFMEGLRACFSTGWCVLPCPTPRGPTGSQNSTWGVLGRRSWTMRRCRRSSVTSHGWVPRVPLRSISVPSHGLRACLRGDSAFASPPGSAGVQQTPLGSDGLVPFPPFRALWLQARRLVSLNPNLLIWKRGW